MRIFSFLFCLCIFVVSARVYSPAFAQRVPAGCDTADSTAATLSCLNRETQRAQEQLSSTFKTVIESQGEEARALLNGAQKDWLVYRDSQCKWEAGLSTAAALTRVYELSCVKELTEARTDLLQRVQEREQDKAPREFGRQPRWMNVLANDYPDIYWRYGEWKSADMDCDGQDEEIMTGIAVAHIQDAVVVEGETVREQAHHEAEMVIALAENPLTGRPKVRLVRLPVSESADESRPHVCRPAVTLEVADMPAPVAETPEEAEGAIPAPETAAVPVCTRVLHVSDPVCGTVTIQWDGKDYSVKGAEARGEAL